MYQVDLNFVHKEVGGCLNVSDAEWKTNFVYNTRNQQREFGRKSSNESELSERKGV